MAQLVRESLPGLCRAERHVIKPLSDYQIYHYISPHILCRFAPVLRLLILGPGVVRAE